MPHASIPMLSSPIWKVKILVWCTFLLCSWYGLWKWRSHRSALASVWTS